MVCYCTEYLKMSKYIRDMGVLFEKKKVYKAWGKLVGALKFSKFENYYIYIVYIANTKLRSKRNFVLLFP